MFFGIQVFIVLHPLVYIKLSF